MNEKQLSREYKANKRNIDRAICRVLSSGRYVNGREVEKFEERFAKFIGTKYCIGVSSGFSALYLCMSALSVNGGLVDIINEKHISETNAVLVAGGIPVYNAEILHTINDTLRAVILTQHPDFTPRYNREDWESWSTTRGIPIIEDACQGFNLWWGDKKCGAVGLAGCFSFHPLKPLHCYGDGGAITTNDTRLNRALRTYRNHGRLSQSSDMYLSGGVNMRLDEIQAAVLNVYLTNWEVK